MIYGKIQRYFNAHPKLTVESLKPKDIEDFYAWIFDTGVSASTVIHYYTILHRAFKQAFKDEMIDVNPFDRIERPKKNKFQCAHYSEEELVALFELSRTDTICPAIVLAGGMVLRRSEALGVRWSRIDMDSRTFLPEYRRRCTTVGRDIMVLQNGVSTSARAVGINDDMSLRVITGSGEISLRFGEVTVRTI